MSAVVDRDLCIGCGVCVNLSPDVFELDDEMIAIVISDIVDDSVEEAMESCPTEAISIE